MALPDVLVAEPAPLQADEDGVWRVGGTRVRLETVVDAFNNGCAEKSQKRSVASPERVPLQSGVHCGPCRGNSSP